VGKNGRKVRHQDSHEDVEYQRVELITGRKRRRDWTEDEKSEILAASVAPGSKVAQVARRYGVSRGLLWTWRRKAMDALAAQTAPDFIPLRIESGSEGAALISEPVAPLPASREQTAGSIEVTIGRARVRVEGAVDPEVLLQMLDLIGPAR
jgi:transposase